MQNEKFQEFVTGEIEKSEDRIQADCFAWFHNTYPALRGLLYHVPNGGNRSQIEANKFKAIGVVSGVPDLEFHFWKRTFFFECKTPKGVVSKDQKKIHSLLTEHGFLVWVFRSLEEFQQIITAIIEDKSLYFQRGSTREDYEYRHNVFMYLYNMAAGPVISVSSLVSEEKREKFKGIIYEFMNDTFDKQAGFEILFTPDYQGFYKQLIDNQQSTVYNPQSTVEVPE
jgi:hypothetical protein